MGGCPGGTCSVVYSSPFSCCAVILRRSTSVACISQMPCPTQIWLLMGFGQWDPTVGIMVMRSQMIFSLAPWSPTLDRKLLHLWFQLPPGRPVHSSSAYRETGFGLLCYHRLTLPFWAEETRLPAVINIWAASPSSSCSVSNFSPSVPHLLY